MSDNTVNSILKQFNKQYGDGVMHTGDMVEDFPRFSTGLFSMDLALGGGLPKGHMTQIYGKQDSGKSLLAYKMIATHQRQFPDETCILVDIEDNYETSWAKKIGIDVEKLIVLSPDHTAQAIDMIEGLIYADGVGLIVLDSIGAMIGQNELESSAEKMAVGGSSLLVGKLCRKVRVAQSKIRRTEEKYPSVVCINQIRQKIGVMYGSDESIPGGNTKEFAVNCTIKLYGKSIMDKKVHDAIPVKLEVNATIRKYKFPITNQAFKYEIVTYPHNGLSVGSCYDWNTVSHYLKDLGYLKKAEKGGGYTCLGETYKTVSDLKAKALGDFEFYQHLKDVVTETVLKESEVLSESVSEETEKK